MKRTVSRFFLPTVVLAAAAGLAACSHPLTDITATNVEDVGRYEVTQHVTGDELAAQVCVDPGGEHEAIAERVLLQLMNHGYRTMKLDLFTAEGESGAAVTRVTWSRDQGQQTTGQETVTENPCRSHEAEPAAAH